MEARVFNNFFIDDISRDFGGYILFSNGGKIAKLRLYQALIVKANVMFSIRDIKEKCNSKGFDDRSLEMKQWPYFFPNHTNLI